MSAAATAVPIKKSTSVRFAVRALRAGFPVLGAAAPTLAARLAATLFGTPPRRRTSEAEWIALSRATPGRVEIDGTPIATWAWGEGPAVLLVHGWGSRGARLHSFVEPLVEGGRRVVTFDAPAHGASGGRRSSLPEFASAIARVADAAGGVEAVIAHSIGGLATAFAIERGLGIRRAVFVAPPANPDAFTDRFAGLLAIPPHVIAAMKRRFENRFDMAWADLDVPRRAQEIRVPLLVIHDRDDAEIPWEDGATIAEAWPGARLVTTEGLGHTRIVHDPEVVAQAVAFITADAGHASSQAS